MATRVWQGDAAAVAQITTCGTITASNSQTYTLTINGNDVAYTADASASIPEITAALTARWNGTEAGYYTNTARPPEMEGITAADSGTAIVLTGQPGIPFTVTAAATGGGAITASATQAATGPNHWDNADNWSGGSVPTASDDVFVENSAVDILWGIDQNTVALTSLTIAQSYTGSIGLPFNNEAGFAEYRERWLKIRPGTLTIGRGAGNGSGRINIDTGTAAAATVYVYGSGNPLDTGLKAVQIVGSHSSNVLNVFKGSVGVCEQAGTTAQFPDFRVGYLDSVEGDSDVRVGTGMTTITSVTQSGGVLELNCGTTALVKTDGETRFLLSGAHASITADGGVSRYQSSGTCAVLIVGGGATVDFRGDLRSKTVSACDIFAGATLLDPDKTVTWTAGVDLNRCSLSEVTLDIGTHVRVTRGSVA